MQRPKPLVTPFPGLRYGNSCMRSTIVIDMDLTITIAPELKGVEGHLVLIPLLFYEIQWPTGFQSFPRTLTTHHVSPPMNGPDPS